MAIVIDSDAAQAVAAGGEHRNTSVGLGGSWLVILLFSFILFLTPNPILPFRLVLSTPATLAFSIFLQGVLASGPRFSSPSVGLTSLCSEDTTSQGSGQPLTCLCLSPCFLFFVAHSAA